MGTIDIDSVTIFNSPLVSVKVLSKLGYKCLLKAFAFAFTHSILIISVIVSALGIYFIPGPHKPVYFM